VLVLSASTPALGRAAADSLVAQEENPRSRQIAFRGGATFTRIDHSGELPAGFRTEPIAGWMFGCDLRWSITDHWSIDSGVHVQRKGNVEHYYGPLEILGFPLRADLETVTTLTYIVLPMRIKMAPAGRVKPYVRAGFDLGFLTSATSHMTGTISGNTGSAPIDQKEDVKDQAKDFEFAFALDVGLQVPLGRADAFLEVTGNLGVTDIAKSDGNDRNQLVGVALGVVLP
jgi:hypothetical protein